MQGQKVGAGTAAAAKTSRGENLEAAVARVAYFHGRVVAHFLHHDEVSTLSSPAIHLAVLEKTAYLALVVYVKMLLLKCQLVVDLI